MIKNFLSVLLVGALSSVALGQHTDIEFGYDNNASPQEILIEQPATSSEGFQFFEADFAQLTAADPFETDDPGFETVNSATETLIFNPGDGVFIRALDASVSSLFGLGFVNYYDPNTGMLSASGEITIGEDATNSTSDLVLNGSSIVSGDTQLIGVGDSDAADPGGIHDHVGFQLTGDTVGAYGVLVQVEADFGGIDSDSIDATSAPFWLIFNRGLTEEQFEGDALAAFGIVESVPEPTAAFFLSGVAGVLLARRRRRLV